MSVKVTQEYQSSTLSYKGTISYEHSNTQYNYSSKDLDAIIGYVNQILSKYYKYALIECRKRRQHYSGKFENGYIHSLISFASFLM